jgi:1-acyl-sn-glycerol-3-phosphate acyltransferase
MSALRRRAVTFTVLVLAALLVTCALPLLLVLAFTVDLARAVRSGRPWMATRLTLFLFVYLLAELVGLCALGLAWLLAGAGPSRAARLLRGTWLVQTRWVSALFLVARRLFSLDLAVEGMACCSPGPILVFARHCSIVDTLLPTALLSRERGYLLRFVLKRELLWDPCIDVAGLRMPNVFVARDQSDTRGEVLAVGALARSLGPTDGVLLYPEGTRFSLNKQRRILERLAARDPAAHARALALRHVLPPRLGGALALLEAGDADVVFLAHTGLEGFASLGALFRLGFARRTVRVRAWRVARTEIPSEPAQREQWLHEQWQRLDRELDAMDALAGASARADATPRVR